MKYIYVLSALVASTSAHGTITQIQGANGVNMPGLSGKSFEVEQFWTKLI
jgi:hypothetical protein